jgi:hypothetical protein
VLPGCGGVRFGAPAVVASGAHEHQITPRRRSAWKSDGNDWMKPGEDRAGDGNAKMRRGRIVTRFVRLDESGRNCLRTPVTPEVAGSSPVAPVKAL